MIRVYVIRRGWADPVQPMFERLHIEDDDGNSFSTYLDRSRQADFRRTLMDEVRRFLPGASREQVRVFDL